MFSAIALVFPRIGHAIFLILIGYAIGSWVRLSSEDRASLVAILIALFFLAGGYDGS